MRVALVHDYIKEYGGAERVLEALHEVFPDAPVYTSVYLPNFLGPHKNRFKNWNIKTSIAQYLPFKAKLISPLRLFAPFLFSRFDFSGYDVVIVSSTGGYIPNSIRCHPEFISGSTPEKSEYQNHGNKRSPIHICYCHTPPRYLYGYATARDWKNNIILRSIGEIANHFLRQVDYKAAQNVDYFIANSLNIRSRIKKFYRRESTVVYPPVDTGEDTKILRYKDTKKNSPNIPISQYPNISGYFITGGRLARAKHVDLIVETCVKLGIPLKVFGKGFAGSPNIPISQYPNIQFLGEVTDSEKSELMRNAKAFIMASEEEDFGITPVEAMGAGIPVIAYKSGGLIESVIEGKTGLFFEELSTESLIKAIQQFNNSTIDPKACITQAQKFSKERFNREIKKYVESLSP